MGLISGVRDRGLGFRKKTYSGSRIQGQKAPDPESAILIANHLYDIINDLNGLRLHPQKFTTRRKNFKIL
jgi:hypothetical protein